MPIKLSLRLCVRHLLLALAFVWCLLAPAHATALDPGRYTLPVPYEEYAREGASQMASLRTETFTTRHHPKAHGMSVSFNYPRGWKATEAGGPVIQSFESPGGTFGVAIRRVPLELPAVETLTAEQAAQRLTLEGIRGFLPDSGFIIGVRPARLDDRPACLAQFTGGVERDGAQFIQHTTAYFFILHDAFVVLEGFYGGKDEAEFSAMRNSAQNFRNHTLFHAMVRTLRIEDQKYETHAAASSALVLPPAATPSQPAIPALSPPLQELAADGDVTSVPIFWRESSPFLGAVHLLLLPALCGVLTLLSLSRYLRGRDKDAPQGRYLPGRVAYLGWHLVVLAIVAAWVLVINLVFAVPQVVGSITMGVGLCVGLAYLSIRRLEDIGWSPWLAAIGLFPVLFFYTLWLPLRFPTQIFVLGALALCFIPGRPRAGDPAPGQATTTAAEDLPPEPEETEAAAETPTHPAFEPEIEIESEATETSEYASAPATTAATAPRTLPAPPSLITLWQAGQTYGPYPAPEVLRLWDAGQVAGNASYWREGMPDYRPLAPEIDHLRTLVETGR